MNFYGATLSFCALIAVVVSAALHMQGVETAKSKNLFERLGAQKKAAQKQLRSAWKNSGELSEKKQKIGGSAHSRALGHTPARTLPRRPIDIKPLFAKGCDEAFESLVFEISQMPRPLFDAFLKSARRRYEENNSTITLWDLAALPFDSEKERAVYFSHCKGKNSWLRRIKIENIEAKIPVHQISDEVAFLLFDSESAKRLIAKRERLIKDASEPFWNGGELLQLKTKNPLWRTWLQTDLDMKTGQIIIEQTSEGSACVERVVSR